MRFREVLRFELAYQLRRASTWLYFAVIVVVAVLSIRNNYVDDARDGAFLINAPLIIAAVTVIGSVIWLLVAAAIAGDAAARDVQTGMHPLMWTTPVSRAEYLGGRFLAAFAVNAVLLLGVPAGILIALLAPGIEPAILGPFRPAAFLSAYAFIALPNAFAVSAIQFAFATLSRRPIASYLASLLLFITAYTVSPGVGLLFSRELGKMLDPIGVVAILSHLSASWTPIEKNTRLVLPEGTLLWNRLLWLGIALGALAFTFRRFRFAHGAERSRRSRAASVEDARSLSHGTIGAPARSTSIAIPRVRASFGFSSCVRQTLAIAWVSFRAIAKHPAGLPFLAIIAGVVIIATPVHMGVPLLPRTDELLTFLTAPLGSRRTPWVIIPLLITFYAGELVWREREAGLSEITDAASVPEWVVFLGKFLGLGLVLVAWLALQMTGGVLQQVRLGYHDFEIARYVEILFGLQLVDYLLFAMLALVVHVVVNQKYIGHLVSLIAYGLMSFGSMLGLEHHLLVYGTSPEWSYTEMRGFGTSLGPWLWFKLYWAAWALLLAVAARLLWVRSRDVDLAARMRVARGRLTRATLGIGAGGVALVLALGGFTFYNTNVLNEFVTAHEWTERSAMYERRYGRYENVPQPRHIGTSLHVEIHPDQHTADIRGSYRLVNSSAVPIDSIHVATRAAVETRAVTFDRPAMLVVEDEELEHRIYALKEPLRPGDSLTLHFDLRFEPHGFRNGGADASVVANGTYFRNRPWFPAIGYQRGRTLSDAGDRRTHGLPPRVAIPSLYDVEARQDISGSERIAFDAVVGTDDDQVAVAPGVLRRTWTEKGRRYFHYVADAPILDDYPVVSANYALHEGRWKDVAIEIFNHPEHTGNAERVLRSVQASLEWFTAQYGPYPYRVIRIVEHPGPDIGAHADGSHITHEEGFTRFAPDDGPRGLDLPFYIVAHEVAHQWWGAAQLAPAPVEGAILLVEGLATYSGMQVLENAYGPEQMRRFLREVRASYEVPRTRATVPLLRATDGFLARRKAPLALYALSRYIGQDRVNSALRRLIEKHGAAAPPLPTTLDLYRELQAVTPDSLHYLLYDLFEANTYWALETDEVSADSTATGEWRVTLDVRARKVVIDTAAVETEVPMDDLIEIGVFAPDGKDQSVGRTLYLEKHRVRSGRQTITVTVRSTPGRAGIDPDQLLIDLKPDDNVRNVRPAVGTP